MDPSHVSRLKEEQERSLNETVTQIKKWETFSDDYTALQDRLRTLPDNVSQTIMVPFGPMAFMPGQIVHTNEVMVLLGDNWFAERSAKQACEVIDRRKGHLQSMLSDLAKQKQLLESRLGFTSELKDMSENKGDLVDIREEYDPEKEANWREERKKKAKEATARKRQKEPLGDKGPASQIASSTTTSQEDKLSQKATSDSSQSRQTSRETKLSTEKPGMEKENRTLASAEDLENAKGEDGVGGVEGSGRRMTEEELWARLNELERQEGELDELALMSDDETETVKAEAPSSNDKEGKHVHWQDNEQKQNNTEDDEDNDSQSRTQRITFRHTALQTTNTEVSKDSHSATTPTEISTALRTPADIFSQYVSLSAQNPEGESANDETVHHENHPIKSILKDGSESHLLREGRSKFHPLKADGLKSHPLKADDVNRMQSQHSDVKPHVILPAPASAFSGRVTERADDQTRIQDESTAAKPVDGNAASSSVPKKMSRFKAARQQQR